MTRDLVYEMDVLKNQMTEPQQLVYQALMERKPGSASNQSQHRQEIATTPAIYEAPPRKAPSSTPDKCI